MNKFSLYVLRFSCSSLYSFLCVGKGQKIHVALGQPQAQGHGGWFHEPSADVRNLQPRGTKRL